MPDRFAGVTLVNDNGATILFQLQDGSPVIVDLTWYELIKLNMTLSKVTSRYIAEVARESSNGDKAVESA